MIGFIDTAGERLQVECELPWVARLLEEGAAGAIEPARAAGASVTVRVESERRPFETAGWKLLTRGACASRSEVVVENVLTSGFDMRARCVDDRAEFTLRWRPPPRERLVARVMRSRFHLLARAALLQYPVLWWAGVHGRVPVHASACTAGTRTPLIASPSGVGRSTLLAAEIDAGGVSTGDNLAVTDGTTVWGLVEPVRMSGLSGRKMPHGRGEAPLAARAESLAPDALVLMSRGDTHVAQLTECSADDAGRSVVTSTYMAGELRRYWAYAATLSAGTGVGPAHPPVADVAEHLASALPCYSLALGDLRSRNLTELMRDVQVEGAWA